LYIVLTTLYINSFAQQYSLDIWHNGKILLKDSTIVEGAIKYNYINNFIEIRDDYAMKIVSANQMLEVVFKDNLLLMDRKIKVYPFQKVSNYKTDFLFEPLTIGKIDLLCREAIGYSTYSPAPIGMNQGMGMGMGVPIRSFRTVSYQYFIRKANGNIVHITRPRKQIKQITSDKKEQMKQYIKDHIIRWNNREDLVYIIRYYNSLP
jgi:hypothetical protein